MKPTKSMWGRAVPAGIICIAIAGGCGVQPVKLAHEQELQRVRTVAVMPFVDAPGAEAEGSGNIVVNATIAELYRFPGVTVVERSRLKSLMNEHDLQMSSIVTTSKATELGKLAGADVVVLGEVTQYQAQQESSHSQVYIVSGGGTTTNHRVGLSVRFVDTNTGQVIYCELGQGVDKGGFSEASRVAAQKALAPLRRFYEQHRSPRP